MQSIKNIAVIGGGISGNTAAYYLSKQHNVTLFESASRLGGHTDTHQIIIDEKSYNIDTGFIVFNYLNYPNFTKLINELGVESQASNMSFSVQNLNSGLEYNATNLNKLFCQRRNILSPRFYRMLQDLIRFYREAPQLLETNIDITLGQYLEQNGYSKIFVDDHLIPMACALWSGPAESIRDFPAHYFVSFMHNHSMMNLLKRPEWRVIKGGSHTYVNAIEKQLQTNKANIVLNSKISAVSRSHDGVFIINNDKEHQFDAVFFATHSDQALKLLSDASHMEKDILSSIKYQTNQVLLHTDESVMPVNKKAWASWNVRVSAELNKRCTVNYHMNQLQSLDSETNFIVSLNNNDLINSSKVLVERIYDHPIYTNDTINAQERWQDINGVNKTWYCGAYWGWGFHEDGVSSALRAVEDFSEYLSNITGVQNAA